MRRSNIAGLCRGVGVHGIGACASLGSHIYAESRGSEGRIVAILSVNHHGPGGTGWRLTAEYALLMDSTALGR